MASQASVATRSRELVVYVRQDSIRFPLPESGEVSIGRGPRNDVRIDDSSVSRNHVVLRISPTKIEVEDLGSSNGTTLLREQREDSVAEETSTGVSRDNQLQRGKPLSISVKISDNDKTFAIKVKRGMGATAEVIETFDNLTTDDFRKRIEESKFIVLNDALAQAIILDVSKQRLLKAMAVRHAQIGAEFKETVVDPIKAYEAAKLQTLIVAEDEPEDSGIRASTLERLRVAAEAAQAKLRVFGSVKDKNLGMRLAIMTRSQRTKYWADIHRAEGDRKRKRLANAKRKAKKARRR